MREEFIFSENTLGDVLLIFDTITSQIKGGITKNATTAFNIEIKAYNESGFYLIRKEKNN